MKLPFCISHGQPFRPWEFACLYAVGGLCELQRNFFSIIPESHFHGGYTQERSTNTECIKITAVFYYIPNLFWRESVLVFGCQNLNQRINHSFPSVHNIAMNDFQHIIPAPLKGSFCQPFCVVFQNFYNVLSSKQKFHIIVLMCRKITGNI